MRHDGTGYGTSSVPYRRGSTAHPLSRRRAPPHFTFDKWAEQGT